MSMGSPANTTSRCGCQQHNAHDCRYSKILQASMLTGIEIAQAQARSLRARPRTLTSRQTQLFTLYLFQRFHNQYVEPLWSRWSQIRSTVAPVRLQKHCRHLCKTHIGNPDGLCRLAWWNCDSLAAVDVISPWPMKDFVVQIVRHALPAIIFDDLHHTPSPQDCKAALHATV